MRLRRFFSILLVLMCCISITPPAFAEENSNSGSGSSNELIQGLMGILQESIDEFIGSYKGRLGDVKLLERLGNKIVLEVTYDNIKRSDNVYVQGEVRNFGTRLEGFSNALNPVSGSQGKVKLAIGWSQKEDNGWDTAKPEEKSDQIRLFLVRESNPDRPFGELIYDISKTWTRSDEPDDGTMVADDDSIELENGATDSGSKPPERVFVKPGTILRPYTPVAVTQPAPQATAPTATPQAAVQTTPQIAAQTATRGTPPLNTAIVRQSPQGVQSYDFYANAKSAKWQSSAGPLSFPGSGNDRNGFVRQISNGHLNSGNAAIDMLETHPEWKSGGWIDGHYPLMILGDNLHFKSVVGFLKGANATDGAIFRVYVKEDNKYRRVANSSVTSRNYVSVDADLSGWSGKKVQLVLRVLAGNNSDQDWAVWVKPHLTK